MSHAAILEELELVLLDMPWKPQCQRADVMFLMEQMEFLLYLEGKVQLKHVLSGYLFLFKRAIFVFLQL